MTDTMHGSTFSSFSLSFSIMHGTNNKAKNVGPILSYKKTYNNKKTETHNSSKSRERTKHTMKYRVDW